MEKPSTNGRQLNNLLVSIYPHLFNHLHIVDLLNLKSASEGVHPGINGKKKIQELSFINDSVYSKDVWFTLPTLIQLRYQINISRVDVLKNPPNCLLKLRRLKICEISGLSISLNDLNKFVNLQILVIGRLYINEKSNLLQMPYLRALSVDVIRWEDKMDVKLVIDARVRSLKFGDDLNVIKRIEFKRPYHVFYLKVNSISNEISMFKNLNCLELRDFPPKRHMKVIKNSEKLRKLRFWQTFLSISQAARLRSFIESKRDDLAVIFQTVIIREPDQLRMIKDNDILRSDADTLEYQLSNYDGFGKNQRFITNVNYNQLVRLLPDGEPAELFERYINIQRLYIKERIEDENRLINFIRRCKNLSGLFIYERSLVSQQFYDQLSEISSLTYLDTNDTDINFEFLKRMVNLIGFYIGGHFLDNEDFNLNDLKCLRKFSLTIDNNRIVRIDKYGENRFIGFDRTLKPSRYEFNSLEASIKWIRSLKDKN